MGKNPATLILSTQPPHDPVYHLLSKPWSTTIHHCARENIFNHLADSVTLKHHTLFYLADPALYLGVESI